jgi:hypothetical protein
MTSWFLDKTWFTKSIGSKHIIFNNSYKIHQISYAPTINNLWLPLLTFFRWSPIKWRPHQCVHNKLDNSSHLWIHFVHILNHLVKWDLCRIVQEIFYVQFSTHVTFARFSTKYAMDLIIVQCNFTIHWGEFAIPNLPWLKNSYGTRKQMEANLKAMVEITYMIHLTWKCAKWGMQKGPSTQKPTLFLGRWI